MSRPPVTPSERPTRARLIELIDAFSTARVHVAGDVVLDEFQFGEIARVSREAPVLILEHRREDLVPGGAGNTALNLADLGVTTALCARVGDDAAGKKLRAELAARGVNVEPLVVDPGFATPTKTRILAGSPHTAKQQIVRIDRGSRPAAASPAVCEPMQSWLAEQRRSGAALLLADYGYGLVDPGWIEKLGPGTAPLTLDSRFRLNAFRQVDAATPNLEELENAVGRRLGDDDENAIAEAAEALRAQMKARALLVTRGSRGMTLVGEPGVQHVPVFGSDEIADVTGAGDTVIAVFTAARAVGASWVEAAELANVAGGLVVMKRGTATVERDEMVAAIHRSWS